MNTMRHAGGWLLVELMLASVSWVAIMGSAMTLIFAIYLQSVHWHMIWQRVNQVQHWTHWVRASLDVSSNNRHCHTQSAQPSMRVSHDWAGTHCISTQGMNKRCLALSVHACQWYEGRWQWITSVYYLKTKRGQPVLYEKMGTHQAKAWLPGISSWTVQIKNTKEESMQLVEVTFHWGKGRDRVYSRSVFGSQLQGAEVSTTGDHIRTYA